MIQELGRSSIKPTVYKSDSSLDDRHNTEESEKKKEEEEEEEKTMVAAKAEQGLPGAEDLMKYVKHGHNRSNS